MIRPPFLDFRNINERFNGFNVVEPKFDGIWGAAHINGAGVQMYSRHGNPRAQWDAPGAVTNPAVIHGEFMHGSTWANERGLTGRFFVFDCTQFGGADISAKPLCERRAAATAVVEALQDARIEMAPQYPIEQARARWRELVIEQRFEGLVLKNTADPFGAQWARIKRRIQVDFVCVGFRPGGGKFNQAAASITAGAFVAGELRQVCSIGGLCDSDRFDFWNDQAAFVGRVFRATGQRVFKSGALRHGVFDGWHQDKRAQDCTLDSILSLL